jgi:Fe-S cluster assembly ATP-binding protein
MTNHILNIKDLDVLYNEKKILDKFNLSINYGEIHVLMGPNGVGKSTLAKVLTGDLKQYKINGNIIYDDKDLLSLSPNELALLGIFLSFQNPIEIPGVSNSQFLKVILNNKRKSIGLDPIDNNDFSKILNEYMDLLNIKKEFLYRFVNVDFSGGEKKRNEILQMLLLDPKFIILDEIDSGLDIDSLKNIFSCINNLKSKNRSMLIITHYTKILDYIDIDYVHILSSGKILKTGDKNLAIHIQKNGYENLI